MNGIIQNTIQAHIVYLDNNSEYKHLVLKRAASNAVYPGLWQVVTGRIELGEKAIVAAIREVKEETGLDILDVWTLPFTANFFNPYTDTVSLVPVFGFLVKDCHTIISDEHEFYQWLAMEEALDLLVLPSHKDGLKIFNDFILSQEDKSLFKYNGDNLK